MRLWATGALDSRAAGFLVEALLTGGTGRTRHPTFCGWRRQRFGHKLGQTLRGDLLVARERSLVLHLDAQRPFGEPEPARQVLGDIGLESVERV